MDEEVRAILTGAATIVLQDGPDGADIVPSRLAAAGRIGREGQTVVLGWLPGERPWTAQLAGARALMGGYGVRTAIKDGRADYVPIRLSAIPSYLATLPRPIVTVVRGDGHGGFGPSVGWGPAAAALADAVVVEVDPGAAAAPLPTPRVPGNVVGTVEGTPTPVAPTWPEPDDVDRAIVGHAVRALPPSPTLQYGPGPLLDAIVRAVDRPVGIYSGLVTDAVVELARDGRLRDAVTGYLWGSDALADLARDGRLRFAPLEETHDTARLAAIPQFVALNTALQVGLDGSVNVERIGGDVVGGVGGHADFARGAHACPDGFSVVLLRSQHRGRSTIVATPEVVTTARTDVDLVVTEHGVADLRGRSDPERARLLVDLAHPDHRDALMQLL